MRDIPINERIHGHKSTYHQQIFIYLFFYLPTKQIDLPSKSLVKQHESKQSESMNIRTANIFSTIAIIENRRDERQRDDVNIHTLDYVLVRRSSCVNLVFREKKICSADAYQHHFIPHQHCSIPCACLFRESRHQPPQPDLIFIDDWTHRCACCCCYSVRVSIRRFYAVRRNKCEVCWPSRWKFCDDYDVCWKYTTIDRQFAAHLPWSSHPDPSIHSFWSIFSISFCCVCV